MQLFMQKDEDISQKKIKLNIFRKYPPPPIKMSKKSGIIATKCKFV